MRKRIWQTGEFWVADVRWITTREMSRRLADRSMSAGRQPGKPGWLATVVNLTGGTARRLVPAEWISRCVLFWCTIVRYKWPCVACSPLMLCQVGYGWGVAGSDDGRLQPPNGRLWPALGRCWQTLRKQLCFSILHRVLCPLLFPGHLSPTFTAIR